MKSISTSFFAHNDLAGHGFGYGSGVWKIEPSEAKRIRPLLPNQLNKSLVYATFVAAEKELMERGGQAARDVMDAWLYKSIPGLGKALPLWCVNLARIEAAMVNIRTIRKTTPKRAPRKRAFAGLAVYCIKIDTFGGATYRLPT